MTYNKIFERLKKSLKVHIGILHQMFSLELKINDRNESKMIFSHFN